jgi:hypothetical protein
MRRTAMFLVPLGGSQGWQPQYKDRGNGNRTKHRAPLSFFSVAPREDSHSGYQITAAM